MASRSGVIAEVKTREGDHIKFASKSEDSTRVPIAAFRTATTALLGWFGVASQQSSDAVAAVSAQETTKRLANDNATKVSLGEQDVAVKTFVPPE